MNASIDVASKELWEKAKSFYINNLVSPEERGQVERYMSMITSVTRQDDKFIICTSNSYAADYLKDNYSDRLKKCLELISDNASLELTFTCDTTKGPTFITPEIPKVTQNNKVKPSTFSSTLPLDESYTFENFVEGPSNSWAVAAAQGVVSHPGLDVQNPLFIHGGTGLGKTHLMQAIGNELKRRNPSLSICYLTAETFLNEYVNHVTSGNIAAFRNRYRAIDILMVDDIQFLQKGKQCQEEFFNTFDTLRRAHKQIVMTSDVAPQNIPAVESRLISRFQGGMVQEIESPIYETRLAILRKKCEGLDVTIPKNALEFIADTIKSHVRAMEGALRKVYMYRKIDPLSNLNNEILSHLLKDYIEKEKNFKNISIEEIQATIAKKFSISMAQMLSMERTQSIVTPRQLAMYISRKFTTKSLPEIAKMFDKTHATIIHGVKAIEKRLDVEEDLKSTLSEILDSFGYKMSDKIE